MDSAQCLGARIANRTSKARYIPIIIFAHVPLNE
jgi:hypothetical protein